MFELTIWDGLIVAAYVAFCLTVAISLKRRGERHGLKSFVAADRNMPWWLLGTSMVATTFSAETPLLISGWVYESGISRNWEWWCYLPGAMLTTFFFARLWRRTEVLTDAEYITLRYSGAEARVLRGFRAVYMGLIFNTVIIGSQFFVCGKIGTILLGIEPGQPHYEAVRIGVPIACAALAMANSALAGISGILVTDFVMFILKLIAAIAVCVYALKQPAVGGLANLKSQFLPVTGQGTVNTSGTGPTFGSRGLPCTPTGGTCPYQPPTSYITFMQNSRTTKWEAVTVTPAGRVRIWSYGGTTWSPMN